MDYDNATDEFTIENCTTLFHMRVKDKYFREEVNWIARNVGN